MRMALRQQLTAASVSRRQFTGVGFFVDFAVPESVPRLDRLLGTELNFKLGDVGAIFEDVNVEVGFVLFVRGGRIHMLEGYTYGDETWPEPQGRYRLFYFAERETPGGGGPEKGPDAVGS